MNNPNYPQRPSYTSTSTTSRPPAPVYRYTQQFLQERSKLRQATWGPRLVALLIDFVLVGIPFNILGNIIWLKRTILPTGASTDGASVDTFTIGIDYQFHNLLWALAFGLCAVVVASFLGETLGKRFMNLKVVSEDGKPLNIALRFARAALVAYSLISLGLIGWGVVLPLKFDALLGLNLLFVPGFVVGLGFLLTIFDAQKQTLHDKIVKSYVVIADLTKL
jgi:uncharacterized RDD family membrane protein YckC